MSSALRAMRMISLLFLLAGIGGYIASTIVVEQDRMTLPRGLVLAQGRMIPREIHGTTIYLTREENRRGIRCIKSRCEPRVGRACTAYAKPSPPIDGGAKRHTTALTAGRLACRRRRRRR